jgi:hypothetical protein
MARSRLGRDRYRRRDDDLLDDEQEERRPPPPKGGSGDVAKWLVPIVILCLGAILLLIVFNASASRRRRQIEIMSRPHQRRDVNEYIPLLKHYGPVQPKAQEPAGEKAPAAPPGE